MPPSLRSLYMYVTVGVCENDEKSSKYCIVGPFPFSQFKRLERGLGHEEKNAAQDVSVLATTQRYGPVDGTVPSPITNDVMVGRQSNQAKQ